MSLLQHVLNASLTGLFIILFGYLSSFIVRPFLKVDLPEVCRSWNKNYVMEASLFVSGVLLYFFSRLADCQFKGLKR
jgi:hypothetical protein